MAIRAQEAMLRYKGPERVLPLNKETMRPKRIRSGYQIWLE